MQRTLPAGLAVGIVTYSAADLDPATLAAAGIAADVPLEGVAPESYFGRTIRDGAATLDRTRMEQDVVAAARRLVARHPGMGALVLECANMPPYRDAVAAALGLPVYDAAQLLGWFRAGLPGTAHALRPQRFVVKIMRFARHRGSLPAAPDWRPPMNRLTALAAALGFALALPVAAQTKWDLPTAYPASNFHTENITQFATDVDKASGGKLKIQVHPNASLFKAPEIKRAVQGGQAQAGEILLVNFENEDPLYGLDGIPFLATSYGDSLKLYKASRKALDDKLAKQGMKLLYTVPWPPQGIYTKRTLNSAADMKGLKWRAYSPATSKIAELVGAQPMTVQAAEVSQALATGVIDSYMSSGATGFDSKTYEHIKNWYDTQAWLPKNAVIVNLKAFEALDKPTQAAVLKAAAAAETRGWKLSEEKNGWYVDQLKGKGMAILKPSDQLTADLRRVGNYMLAEWQRKAGEDGKKVIEAYRLQQ